MSKKFKICTIWLVLAMLFSVFSVLSPITASAANENALEQSIANSKECVEFIEDNFAQMIAEYNAAHNEDIACNATSIEGCTLVYLTDINKYGFYLDFDGNNGYLLVTENYTLYEFEPIGDLEYLKNVELAFYSSFDKFMYKDPDTGTYERYVYSDNTSESISGADLITPISTINAAAHDGQHSDGGDGKIYDIDAYVADVYPGYEFVERHIIPDYQWIYQTNTSVYIRGTATEANCVLNAIYSMMNDWIRKGRYTALPSGVKDYSKIVKYDSQYNKYGTGSYNGWTTNKDEKLSVLPTLYYEIRDYGIDLGYDPEVGLNAQNIKYIVKKVAADHGYSINMASSSSAVFAIPNIDDNKACILSVHGSSSFGNHSMGLYGYVEYAYTDGWWIFESTKAAYFFVVDDGHLLYKQNDNRYSYSSGGITYWVSYFDPNTDANPTLTFYYES